MPQIVIISKESKTYFSFDEMCIIQNGKAISDKMNQIPLEVFRFLAEKSPNAQTHEDIYRTVWVERTKKKTEVDKYPSDIIKQHTGTINSYFKDINIDQIIVSEPKMYRCILALIDTENNSLTNKLHEYDIELNSIINEYELVLQKINNTNGVSDSVLLKMYASKIDILTKKYNYIKEKIDNLNTEINDSQWIYEMIDITSKPQTNDSTNPGNSFNKIKHKSEKTEKELQNLYEKVEEQITKYLISPNFSAYDLSETIDVLPKNRETALILLNICENYHIDVIFRETIIQYREFLTDKEFNHIVEKAKKIFDYCIWEYLNID